MQNIKTEIMVKKQIETAMVQGFSNNVFMCRIKSVRASYIYLYVVEVVGCFIDFIQADVIDINCQSYDNVHDGLVPFVSSDSVINRIVG